MPAVASRAAHVVVAAARERTTSLKQRPRCAVAVVAPVACGKMAQEKFARLVVATKPSAPAAQRKTAREVPVVPAPPPPRHLKERAEAERAAREAKDGARILEAKRRRPEAPSAKEAAKQRKTSSSMPATQAAHQRTRTEPAKQQPLPDQSPISKLIEKGKEALKRRRLEEIARAREKFCQELLEVEKAAMSDETIYPEELEELGLTELQYAVTPTRKQALRRRLG